MAGLSQPFEFEVSGTGDQYLDLVETQLYVRFKATKRTGASLVHVGDNKDFVGPVNYTLHSLFKQVDMSLNGQQVSVSSACYPYRANLETLLNYGREAKQDQLSIPLYYKDTAGSTDNTATTDDGANAGLVSRAKHCMGCADIELLGRIHCDVFHMNRYMMKGVNLKLKLIPNSDAFALMTANGAAGYKIEYKKVALYIRRVTPSPTLLLRQAKILSGGMTAKYPIHRVQMRTKAVQAGSTNVISDHLSLGQLHRRLVLGLAKTVAFNGDCTRNPFNFETSTQTRFRNKNHTLHARSFEHYMEGCLEGWHLEVLREANNHQGVAQLCRNNDGSGHWQCAPGWRQLPVDPFCVRSSSPSKPADGMPTIRQPKYAQVSDDRKLLFIHVPKAGGTSIETSFLFKEQREKLGGHYLGGHHKITAFDEDFYRNYHKFGIVRHPCSRLLSVWGYYSQGLGNKGDKEWVDKFMDNVTKSSFEAFVERTLYPIGPVQINKQMHLQTQVGMIFRKNGQFGLDQLLIFEKWDDSMEELGKRINVNVTALKSTHKLSSHHKTCQESYTRKMWTKMTQLYAMDFCVLGYSTEFEKVNITPPIDLTPQTLTLRFRECASKIKQGV
ncbi:hypothetical protein HOLleu_38401 [Holothuria leucospilota]|uniref:Uncharacterized protein n=1 Tax=Holothuria leucospilota TaxID=206669 RepID=A0A9Q0YGY7_HOLLE|nr:hypothetical protein HOLleu_38401 [Holothuria leucospilota]